MTGSRRVLGVVLAFAVALGSANAQSRRGAPTLEVTGAAPDAIVSVDDIRHGRVDKTGTKKITTLAPGRHRVTVRQLGFVDHQETVSLAAGRVTTVKPKSVPVEDPAELAYQRADDLAYRGKNDDAIVEYQAALDARGGTYAEARIGLARALLVRKRFDEAMKAIAPVVETDPKNAEAITVNANILRDSGFAGEAIREYRRAIALAPNKSPEAHAGLAIVLSEEGEFTQSVAEFRKAIAQNDDAEPMLYQLLGATLESMDRPKEAIEAYGKFLALAPQHSLAPAIRSIVDRLEAQASSEDDEDEGDVNPYAPR